MLCYFIRRKIVMRILDGSQAQWVSMPSALRPDQKGVLLEAIRPYGMVTGNRSKPVPE